MSWILGILEEISITSENMCYALNRLDLSRNNLKSFCIHILKFAQKLERLHLGRVCFCLIVIFLFIICVGAILLALVVLVVFFSAIE